MVPPRLRAQDALEVEGTISGDRGSAALRQVQTGTACTNRRGSAVFVMPALLAGLFGYSVSIVSYHSRVDKIGEESGGSGGNSVRALRWLKGLNVRGSLSMHLRLQEYWGWMRIGGSSKNSRTGEGFVLPQKSSANSLVPAMPA
jgi:hypothetical protein